jgi:hypothetical protein
VQRGAVAVRPDREDRRGGLHVGLAHEAARIDAVPLEQRDQRVAERVLPDGAGAEHGRAQLGQHDGGAARRAGRRHADLLDERSALALGDLGDRPREHVEHVRAETDRLHRCTSRVAP